MGLGLFLGEWRFCLEGGAGRGCGFRRWLVRLCERIWGVLRLGSFRDVGWVRVVVLGFRGWWVVVGFGFILGVEGGGWVVLGLESFRGFF